jgi:hypothetical protein
MGKAIGTPAGAWFAAKRLCDHKYSPTARQTRQITGKITQAGRNTYVINQSKLSSALGVCSSVCFFALSLPSCALCSTNAILCTTSGPIRASLLIPQLSLLQSISTKSLSSPLQQWICECENKPASTCFGACKMAERSFSRFSLSNVSLLMANAP